MVHLRWDFLFFFVCFIFVLFACVCCVCMDDRFLVRTWDFVAGINGDDVDMVMVIWYG